MITANELRVGNCLNYSGRLYQINGEDIQFIETDVLYAGRWQGIPLTPEVLERCGFEEDRNGWHLPNTMFSLTEKLYPCWLDRMLWPQDISDFRENKLQHLHELQNLYFALTKKELEYVTN